MSSRDQKRKRRRAEKLMAEAWEAVLAENLHLAGRLSTRARDLGDVNPRILKEHGQIMGLCGEEQNALAALRRAIGLAPDYADARVELAKLHAHRKNFVQAARQQRWALQLAPGDALMQRALAEYMELVDDPALVLGATEDLDGEESERAGEPHEASKKSRSRTDRLPWNEIADDLLRCGCAVLKGLLSGDECVGLRSLYDDEINFEHEVRNDGETDGRVTYRFFKRPLPLLVEELRREVFARAARIVNAWHEKIGVAERFPLDHEEFRAQCAAAGQTRTTPILLHYEVGGFNGLHQDVSGKVVFPLQLAVTLGPGCSKSSDPGVFGGELRLVDSGPGKKVRETRLATALGDGVLFCTRDRLVEIGGVYGRQPVFHGLTVVAGAERFALGVPFHEHG